MLEERLCNGSFPTATFGLQKRKVARIPDTQQRLQLADYLPAGSFRKNATLSKKFLHAILSREKNNVCTGHTAEVKLL